eukprot:gb/GECG01016351.1/.p1 GENE.gb/GECG01016351.1/~~gb/GECG01016351.1/.p1  ORF type:complete len:804 (+),score=133.78 gb/GECG01016351.1/:1-2412(+)
MDLDGAVNAPLRRRRKRTVMSCPPRDPMRVEAAAVAAPAVVPTEDGRGERKRRRRRILTLAAGNDAITAKANIEDIDGMGRGRAVTNHLLRKKMNLVVLPLEATVAVLNTTPNPAGRKKHPTKDTKSTNDATGRHRNAASRNSGAAQRKKGELAGKSIPVFSEEPPPLDDKFSASGSGKNKHEHSRRSHNKNVSNFLYDDAESTPGKQYPFPFQQEETQLHNRSKAIPPAEHEDQPKEGNAGENHTNDGNEQSFDQVEILKRQVESLQQDCRAKDDLIDALQQLESNSVRQQEEPPHTSQGHAYEPGNEATYPAYGEYSNAYPMDSSSGYPQHYDQQGQENEDFQARLENAENAAAEAETRVMSLQRQLEAANVENKMIQEQYDAVKKDNANQENSEEVERLQERVRQLEQELANVRSERDSDMYRFNQLQSRLDDANQRYSMTAEQVSLLQDENRQLRSQVQDLLQKNHRLQQDCDQLTVNNASSGPPSLPASGRYMPKLSQPAAGTAHGSYENHQAVGSIGNFSSGSSWPASGASNSMNSAIPHTNYYAPYRSGATGNAGLSFNSASVSGNGASATNLNYNGSNYDKYAGSYHADPPQTDARLTLSSAARGQLFQGDSMSRSTGALPGIYDSAAASYPGLPKSGSFSSNGSTQSQTGFGLNHASASSAASTSHTNPTSPTSGVAEQLRSLQEQAKARESERVRKKEHSQEIASRQRAAPFATEASSEAHRETAQRKERELMNLNLEKNQLTGELDKLGPGEPRTIEGRRKKRGHERRLEEVEKELSQLRYWLKKYEAQQHT